MGTFIDAYIEIKPERYDVELNLEGEAYWLFIADVSYVLAQNYEMFNSLFGRSNGAEFIPIAAGRGIPDDASTYVKSLAQGVAGHASAFMYPSWIRWDEVKKINWGEEGQSLYSLPLRYVRDKDGDLLYDGLTTAGEITQGLRNPEGPYGFLRDTGSWREGQEWTVGNFVYKLGKLRRKDVVDERWQMVFDMMALLAKRFGDDGVRLVVWFWS